MDAEAGGEKLLDLAVAALDDLLFPLAVLGVLLGLERRDGPLLLRHLHKSLGGLVRVLPRVHEHHHLVPLPHTLQDLLVRDLRHRSLNFALIVPHHAQKRRLKGDRPVRVVEIEEIAVDVDAEEDSHVLVSRERGGQADDADHALRTLDLPERASDDGFEHGAAVFVEQMDLVDDQKFDQRGQRRIRTFAGHDIPLFRGDDEHMSVRDLTARELHISSQLLHNEAEAREALRKLLCDLSSESLHRGHVDDLELIAPQNTPIEVLFKLVEHRHHRTLCLACACWRAH
mmetsp:Transcript_38948/g.91927  ORF Transcript_38948/g.91927 Transcript_38948/m.91927 type:complete len:286 (+) Transcript_38948:4271-5128(+)